MSNDVINKLSQLLADTYTLYLKTQNYHWHVRGPSFKTLHELFESQYRELADGVDELAERLRMLGAHAPATFAEFIQLKSIKEGNAKADANSMICELHDDHRALIEKITVLIQLAQQKADEATVNLLSERISHHEKVCWMLGASREGA